MDMFLLSPLFEKKNVKMSEKVYNLYEEFLKTQKKSKKKLKENAKKTKLAEDVEDKYGLNDIEGIKYSDSFSETGYEEIDSEDYNEDDEVWEYNGEENEETQEDKEDTLSEERYNEIKTELEDLVHVNIDGEDIDDKDKKELIKQYAKSIVDLTDDCHGNESYWSAMVDKLTDEVFNEQ